MLKDIFRIHTTAKNSTEIRIGQTEKFIGIAIPSSVKFDPFIFINTIYALGPQVLNNGGKQ